MGNLQFITTSYSKFLLVLVYSNDAVRISACDTIENCRWPYEIFSNFYLTALLDHGTTMLHLLY